jgi:hypothetical protein
MSSRPGARARVEALAWQRRAVGMAGIEPALASPPVRRPAIGLHPEREPDRRDRWAPVSSLHTEERARAPLVILVSSVVRDRVSVSGLRGARTHCSHYAAVIETAALDTLLPLRGRHWTTPLDTLLPMRESRREPRWAQFTRACEPPVSHASPSCVTGRVPASISRPKTPKAAWVSRGGLRSFRLEKTREMPPTSYPPDPGPGVRRTQGEGRRPDSFPRR